MATTNEPACEHPPTTAEGRPVFCGRCKDRGATVDDSPEWAKREATRITRSKEYAFLSAWERHPVDMVARALAAAYARGREDAAKVCDMLLTRSPQAGDPNLDEYDLGCEACAAAIRAGGA